MTIYKYEIETTSIQILRLPVHHTILKVAEQDGILCMWVEVNPRRELADVIVRVFGTGEDQPHDKALTHIETVLMLPFVWHVYVQH